MIKGTKGIFDRKAITVLAAIVMVSGSIGTIIIEGRATGSDEDEPIKKVDIPVISEGSSGNLGSWTIKVRVKRIQQVDEIDPAPFDQADWTWYVIVDGISKSGHFENGDNCYPNKNYYWSVSGRYVDIKIKLKETDIFTADDIADISACPGGGPDNTDVFPRGAYFHGRIDRMLR